MRMSLGGSGDVAGLVTRVGELSRRLLAIYEAEARRFDLTLPQAMLLHDLDRPTPMREVAERQHCDASNLTGIVDRLEARGLIVRQTPAADRRVKELVLTEEGRRLHHHFAALTQRLPAFQTLEVGERADLERLLGKALAGFPD